MSLHPNKRLREDESCFDTEEEVSDFDAEDLLEESDDSDSSIGSDSENENIFLLPKRKKIMKMSWNDHLYNIERTQTDHSGGGVVNDNNIASTTATTIWEKFKQQHATSSAACSASSSSSASTTASVVGGEQSTKQTKDGNQTSGPTEYAKNLIVKNQVRSSFFLLITKEMMQHIRLCTDLESSRILGPDWKLTEEEFCGFLAILFAQSAYEARDLNISFLWSKKWGPPFFQDTLSRQDFTKILRFLRFHGDESNVNRDKFNLISKVWSDFLDNCNDCYKTGAYLIIEEQFFSTKSPQISKSLNNKDQKSGIKLWIASDFITRYVINGLPSLEFLHKFGESDDLDMDTEKLSFRRWPLRVFFNILDIAGFNSWILYKEATGENITRKDYLFRLAEELAAIYKNSSQAVNMNEILEDETSLLSPGTRKTCQIILCNKNKTTAICGSCKKYVCGVCTERKIAICKKCYTKNNKK